MYVSIILSEFWKWNRRQWNYSRIVPTGIPITEAAIFGMFQLFSIGIFTEHKGGIYNFFVRCIHYNTAPDGKLVCKSQLCAFEQLQRNSDQKSNQLCL